MDSTFCQSLHPLAKIVFCLITYEYDSSGTVCRRAPATAGLLKMTLFVPFCNVEYSPYLCQQKWLLVSRADCLLQANNARQD